MDEKQRGAHSRKTPGQTTQGTTFGLPKEKTKKGTQPAQPRGRQVRAGKIRIPAPRNQGQKARHFRSMDELYIFHYQLDNLYEAMGKICSKLTFWAPPSPDLPAWASTWAKNVNQETNKSTFKYK